MVFSLRETERQRAAMAAEVAAQEGRLEEARARRALRNAGQGRPQ